MADTTPRNINSFTRPMAGTNVRMLSGGGTPTASNWPTANLAVYLPLSLSWSYTVRRLFWANGGTLGNVCVAIFDKTGTGAPGARLATTGTTAQSGTNSPQGVVLGTPLTLSAGQYFVGISFSGTTGAFYGLTSLTADIGRQMGLFQEASAVPFPATATGAAYAQTCYPIVGISRTTVP